MVIVSGSTLANSFVVKNNQGKAVKGIAVYLQPQFSADVSSYSDNSKQNDVLQKGKKFSPYITVIEKGTSPKFLNEDDITHHIYSAVGPKRFSFKLRAEKTKSDITFNETGHVAMGCNVHDWMSGHILVVDTPFYGLTDENGTISFVDLPAGKYELNIWHPQLEAKGNKESLVINWPISEKKVIQVNADMSPIPEQSTLDEFEFLEDY
ncbi:hypothetical protein SOPP22_00975 [Shewanella sp. OPT22]|nr:hypothetical protein SOPP22_00975 [Shewanella sp. OPT22]